MSEFEAIGLEPVESLTITTLVDNVTDILLLDEGPAIRAPIDSRAPRVRSPLIEGGQTLDALRAEHGFAALVTISQGGREHRVLFDTGISPDGLIENMRRLEVSPHDVEVIVLSHGHFDHTTGMDGLIRTLGKANVPVLIHPEFWSRRRLALPGREPLMLPTTSRSALEGAGFEIIEQQQPSFLLAGSLLVTGEVDRTSGFERGFAIHQACRDGEWQPDPLILDDQALIANVAGKGLVVLTACGHAGVVNTVRYARRLTGEDRVHAIVGGFTSTARCSSRSSPPPATRSPSLTPTTSSPRTAPAGAPSTRWPPASPTPTCKPASAPASSFTATSGARTWRSTEPAFRCYVCQGAAVIAAGP